MPDPNLLNDVRFLREVVAKTQRSAGVNRYWPVTLAWGVVISAGYLACALLTVGGKANIVPWVMPVLIFLVGWPLQLYLSRRVRLTSEDGGIRPEFRRDVLFLWLTIVAAGLLWTAWFVVSGLISSHGYLLIFAWCSLHLVGYVMNGVLLSDEWFWAAGALFASLVAVVIAGANFYWFPGVFIPGTYILAGLIGYRNARHQPAAG